MPQPYHVVATGPWDDPDWQAPLEAAGCLVTMGRSIDCYPAPPYADDDLIDLIASADALLLSPRDRLTRPVLAAAPRLRIISAPILGIENVDLAAATDLGILVANSPAMENFLGLAEATVGLILALIKRLPANQRLIREGHWKQRAFFGTLLSGQTVGIVGLGPVGASVCRLLQGWGVRLLVADPYVGAERANACGATLVSLDTLLATADVVSLHVALTAETRHLVGAPQLATMKPSAYLINTSRGVVVDERALAQAIAEERIAGAALDVFEEEPLPPDSPLRSLDPDRLILTPHSIGVNLASKYSGVRMAMESILCALAGQVPDSVRNPAAVSRWRERLPVVI